MIDLIALILLSRYNGKTAARKGLKSGTWVVNTIIAWIVGEMLGCILGLSFFPFTKENILIIMAFGLFGAFGGFLFIKHKLDQIPDHVEEDASRIGVDDLRP